MRAGIVAVALTALVAAGAASAKTSAVQSGQTATATALLHVCALDKNGSLRFISDPALCRKKETGVTIGSGPVHICYQADGSVRKVSGAAACPAPGTYVSLPPQNVPEYFCAGPDGRLRRVSGTGLCGADTELIVDATNHAPTDLSLSAQSIAENQPAGTTVGTFTTTDPDSGDTHTYTLVGGAGSTDNASFTITGNQLKTAAIFNFEVKSSYSIRVRTTDSGGLFFEKVFTITVTDVNEAPAANDDTYSAFGNTELRVAGDPGTAGAMAFTTSPTNPKSNDTDPDLPPSGFANLSVVAASGSTTKGGTFAIQTSGAFKYTPPPGVITAPGDPDTFAYQITDGTNITGATIKIDVSNRIWYVDASRGSGNGTSSSPYNTLGGINGAGGSGDADSPNDYIFLAPGAYGGGLPLETGQKLYGTTHGLVVSSTTLASPSGSAPTNNPVIQNSGGDALTLATSGNNDVQGISLGMASSSGAALKGTNVGTVTVDNVTAGTINSGSGKAVDINGGALTITFQSVSGAGISLTGGTTGNFTGSGGALSGASGAELDVNGGTSNVTYAGSISNSSGAAISVQNKTGGTVTASGNVTDNGGTGTGISLLSNTGATITLSGQLTLSTATNPAFTATGGGTVNAGNAANTITTTTGTALNVANTTVGASGLVFQSVSTNGAANGILLDTIGGNAVTINGGSILAATARGVDINGGSGGFTYTGSITTVASGRSVEVTSHTGGTVLFSGSITDGGLGINLTNNGGATINFTGGLSLTTTANAAFTATGGGTVTVTGSTNTITTTTGTALNVQNTTIGDNDLTFRSISSNGAANGIVLNNTSNANGRLVITGNGGTCTSAGTCTGGAIQFSTAAGVSLTSVPGGASFTRVAVTGGGDDGVRATSVGTTGGAGLDVANSFISTNGNAVGENGLDYDNVKGTSSINNTTATASAEFNARVDTDNGTLLLTVDASTFSSNSSTVGADGLLLNGDGTATIRALVQNSTFNANRDDGFQLLANADSSMDLTFNNNTVHAAGNPGAVSAHAALNFNSNSTSDVRMSMTGGTVDGADGSAIILNPIGTTSTFHAVLDNVTVGTSGVPGSGSATGIGIWAKPTQNTQARIVIKNSRINGTAQNGIQLRHNDGGGTSDFTVTGNVIRNVGAGQEAIFVQSGSLNTDTTTVCADIGGTTAALENDFAGQASGGATDIAFRRPSAAVGAHLKLPGFDGNPANLTSYIQNRNVGSPTVANFSGALEAGPAACLQPTAPTLP